jgi:hypothetical protein
MPTEAVSGSASTSRATPFRSTPERLVLAKILLLGTLSLVVLFLLDAVLFRTGFYVRYLEPFSSAGNFEAVLNAAKQKDFTKPHHVLVLGDSQMGEGFSAKVADAASQSSGWEFFNAAVGGASMRCWYYMIRDLDPDRTRFEVVVLPLRGYADVDDEVVRADREIDVHWVIARLGLADIPEFCLSFRSPLIKLQVLRETLFKGLVYRRDLRDFLRDPAERMRHVRDCRAACADSVYNYPGHAESLNGVRMDWVTDTLHFPDGVSAQVQAEMRLHTHFREWSVRGLERAYRTAWLDRIIERYQGKRTRIALISLPYRPLPIPFSWPAGTGSFVSKASRNPTVTVLDEHMFEDLERPELFFDVFHLNRTGRALFSNRLALALVQQLGSGNSTQ